MTIEIIFALAAFAFVASITPGPNNLMLMASGTNFGFTRTLPHLLGVGLGFMAMILLVGLGLMQIFETFPLTYQILKYASATYLIYLAWKIATAAPPPNSDNPEQATGKPLSFIQASLFQWVNPKAWTMALTAVSVYTLPSQPTTSLLAVVAIFGLVNVPCVTLWTVLGTQLRRILKDPLRLRIFNITAALLLIATLYPILTTPLGTAH